MKKAQGVTKSALESDLIRLDEIISAIESAATPLADSLAMYREGIALAADCAAKLGEIENEVLILTKNAAGVLKTEVFATEDVENEF